VDTPNPAELFITNQDNLQDAKLLSLGNPTNSSTTFNSQSTFVLPCPIVKSIRYISVARKILHSDRILPDGTLVVLQLK